MDRDGNDGSDELKPKSLADALSILALEAVENDAPEYQYRKICRWYSKEYHTPLHLVMDLNEEDVLQHFYEHTFGKLKDNSDLDQKSSDDYSRVVKAVILGDKKSADEQNDDDWVSEMREKVLREQNQAQAPPSGVTFNMGQPLSPEDKKALAQEIAAEVNKVVKGEE